jgi:hypothetical protein
MALAFERKAEHFRGSAADPFYLTDPLLRDFRVSLSILLHFPVPFFYYFMRLKQLVN